MLWPILESPTEEAGGSHWCELGDFPSERPFASKAEKAGEEEVCGDRSPGEAEAARDLPNRDSADIAPPLVNTSGKPLRRELDATVSPRETPIQHA